MLFFSNAMLYINMLQSAIRKIWNVMTINKTHVEIEVQIVDNIYWASVCNAHKVFRLVKIIIILKSQFSGAVARNPKKVFQPSSFLQFTFYINTEKITRYWVNWDKKRWQDRQQICLNKMTKKVDVSLNLVRYILRTDLEIWSGFVLNFC